MTVKTDIKRLMSQGLTGWQAGLLVFEDSWRESLGGESLLTERDISLLKSGLKTQKDTQDYNTLIGLYRTADYIFKEAYTRTFAASSFLERVAGIGLLELGTYLARRTLGSLPLIVTEKELKSLKAKQRRQLLHKYYCLDQVISWRAYALAPEELKEDLDPDWLIEEEAPELYQQAEAEIQALIDAGKLKPVKLDILASSEEARREERQDIEWWPKETEWPPEQIEQKLQTYIQGSQLYKRGWPRWKDEIDTFRLYLLDKEYWIGGEPPPSVAIVQEPGAQELDRRGHFKKDYLRMSWPVKALTDSQLLTDIATQAQMALQEIKKIMVRRQVLEELGQVIGLALEETVDYGIEAILKPSLGRYSHFAADVPPELQKLADNVKLSDEEAEAAIKQARQAGANVSAAALLKLNLPPIVLEKVRPSAKELAVLRDWISPILGDKWWEKASHTAKPKPVLPEEWQEALRQMRGEQEQEAKDES